MKVLIVSKTLPDNFKGGIQTHVWNLSKYLIERGHEVTILRSGSFRKPLEEEIVEGRRIVRVPVLPLRRLPFLTDIFDEMSFHLAAQHWVLRHQAEFDLLHLQGRSGNLMLVPGMANLKIPVVATVHGLLKDEFKTEYRNKRSGFSKYLHMQVASRLESAVLRSANAVIAVSPYAKEKALEQVPECVQRIQVIPNGISLTDLPDKINYTPKELLFVSRFTNVKGPHEALLAMRLLANDVHLTMLGDGPERPFILQKIQEYGLQDRVKSLASMSAAEVMEHMDKAYALFHPSFVETQGIVLMEANARCKPVLVSDLPGIKEVVTDGMNGLVFAVGDIQDMAMKIQKLLDDPELAKKLGQNGRRHMELHFAWEQIAKRTEALYQEVLAESYAKHMIQLAGI
jgi:glycosyltransferase involved in cell wall biosynthesis